MSKNLLEATYGLGKHMGSLGLVSYIFKANMRPWHYKLGLWYVLSAYKKRGEN